MPRNFFHTLDGTKCRDDEGIELPDQAAAWEMGVKYLGKIVRENPGILIEDHHFSVLVSDATGLNLFVVSAHLTEAPAARTATVDL